ncbi:DUF6299 family protein [Streptomyces sp. NPDC017179]|uniref:DUF6299 family protein n=1 Tax=Streptomyces sp. NPDC017179 TaxID=3364979 RepID=UPI0037A05079
MPLRPVLGALGAAAAAVLTLSTPATAAPDANLTIDQTARLSADGTVTVYGTYRCFDANGLVFVGAAISQDPSATRYGIGGTRAVCDGAYHPWHTSGTVTPNRLTPGPARVEAALVELRSHSGLPLPEVHATHRRDVVLVAD